MLKNFEEITKELNDYEKNVLYPIVIAGLTRHVGKENAISGLSLWACVEGEMLRNAIRKLVEHDKTRANIQPMTIPRTPNPA